MNIVLRFATAAVAVSFALFPLHAAAQSIALDAASDSLATIPATTADVLSMSVPGGPVAGAPPAVVGLTASSLGLLPGDVIDALSYGDDFGTFGADALAFSVDRAALSAGAGPATPDVFSETNPPSLPPGVQGEASSDMFVTFDPAALVFPPLNTQILDGDGAPLAAPLTSYPGAGFGLSEFNALPGPPLNDDIVAFDWAEPGRANFTCALFSLAPGSPTLVAGTNPLLPAGAEPADLLGACPGNLGVAGPPAFMTVAIPAGVLGLVSGGPGCAPPACDDIDALSVGVFLHFSLAPGSPTPAAPGDILAPGPVLAIAAAGLGLAPAENVNALELPAANGCPVFPGTFADVDFDAFDLCDNCPLAFNPGQEDSDFDGTGDL